MAHTYWKGSIAFGLLTVPIKMSVAARSAGINFNLLHNTCKSRISQKTWCPTCEVEITRADTIKGYEASKDNYVIVTPEELANCEPDSNKVMEISETVPADEVDPLLFESSYYFEPELAGRKGYQLLHAALVAEKRYAIAKFTNSGREHTVVIRPAGEVLAMHTMFLHDEVREAPVLQYDGKISPGELKLARQLVAVNAASFDHAQYKDDYLTQVEAMLEAKANGAAPAQPVAAKKREPVIDIMAALEASIKNKGAGSAKKGRKAA